MLSVRFYVPSLLAASVADLFSAEAKRSHVSPGRVPCVFHHRLRDGRRVVLAPGCVHHRRSPRQAAVP